MLTLYGLAASNYYNKIGLALLEKGLPFKESLHWPNQTDGETPPLHEMPYLRDGDLGMCESQVIIDYLEAHYPERPPVLTDPFQAAKAREMVAFLESHLEPVARQLFPEAFLGGKVSDNLKVRMCEQLQESIPVAAKLFKFSPYVVGDTFTTADYTAIVHFPLVSQAIKITYGEDLLTQVEGVKPYLTEMAENPNVQEVRAGSRVNLKQMLVHYVSKC